MLKYILPPFILIVVVEYNFCYKKNFILKFQCKIYQLYFSFYFSIGWNMVTCKGNDVFI